MGQLSDGLDVLVQELEAQGALVRRTAAADEQAVRDAFNTHGLRTHPDAIEFFTWIGETWLDVFLRPISLERALNVRGHWEDAAELDEDQLVDLIPLLSGNGEVHISLHLGTGELHYVVGNLNHWFAASAMSALGALNAGLLSGALAYDPDEVHDIVEADPRWGEIRDEHGVSAKFWHQ